MVCQPSSSAFIRVAVLITACWLVQPGNSQAGHSVTFNLVEGHWIVAPVTIRGSGPYQLILDTGSNQSILDPSLISELDGKVVGQNRLVTAAESSLVSCYRMMDFQLGMQRVEYLDVLAVPVPDDKSRHARGILGQDFLARFNFILDYKSRTLTFEENHEFEQNLCGTVYSLLASAHRRLVMIPPQSGESRPSLFALDSGAEGVVLFGSDFKGLGFDLDSRGGVKYLHTLNGRGFISCGQFRSFRIGDTTFRDLPVWLAHPGELLKYRPENGLLPTTCFQTIYINNAENFVVFNPRFESGPRMDEK